MPRHITERDLSRLIDLTKVDDITITKSDQQHLLHLSDCQSCRELYARTVTAFETLEQGFVVPDNKTQQTSILQTVLQQAVRMKQESVGQLKEWLDDILSIDVQGLVDNQLLVNFRALAIIGAFRGNSTESSGAPAIAKVNLLINHTPFAECKIAVPTEQLIIAIESIEQDVMMALLVNTTDSSRYQVSLPATTASGTEFRFHAVEPATYQFFFYHRQHG